MNQDCKRQSVLFLIGNLGVGGKERQLIELIYGLSPERFELHLLAKNITSPHFRKIAPKLSSLRTLDRGAFKIQDLKVIRDHIVEVKPDSVSSWSDVLSHFCLVTKPFTFHPYTLLNCSIRNSPIKLSARKTIERYMYDLYPYVVANSRSGIKSYGQKGKKGRFILYNGFDMSRVPPISKEEARNSTGLLCDNGRIVTMVASLTDKKDHETLIRAAKICIEKGKKYRFILVGDGPRKQELMELIDELGLQEHVLLTGKRSDIEIVLKASDLSVLVSTAHFGEGISNTIIESLACGVPTIATDSPGTREVIRHAENGMIVPPSNHKELAKEIIGLLEGHEKRKKISDAGRRTIRDKFSMKKCCEEFERILTECHSADAEKRRSRIGL